MGIGGRFVLSVFVFSSSPKSFSLSMSPFYGSYSGNEKEKMEEGRDLR